MPDDSQSLVRDFELGDFEIIRDLSEKPQRRVSQARLIRGGDTVQLTVFSSELSQRPEFRRALKTDRAMLLMLQHQSIVRFLGSGESEGQLFYWCESCDFESLAAHRKVGRQFSCEDIIEIGWQICSALQQAHNLGLVHGGLSADTVLLSDNLQVMVSEFGVVRWLKASEKAPDAASETGSALITISVLASRADVEKDLRDLAVLLRTLLDASSEEVENDSGAASSHGPLERLLSRCVGDNPALRPVSAREFQGRLGEILIGSGDDTMPLVDHRQTSGTSRRSIVVELFESPESIEQIRETAGQSAGSARGRQILPIIVAVLLLILVMIIAGWLR